MRVLVAQALPPVAQALPPGCAGSARFLQKQSQLLVRLTWTGMDLDWSLTKIQICGKILPDLAKWIFIWICVSLKYKESAIRVIALLQKFSPNLGKGSKKKKNSGIFH